jgi:lipoate-protein ligase A
MTMLDETRPRGAEYDVAVWRVLETGWQDGPSNMAIDEAILQGVASGNSPPTLRLYGWDPPCLSLGYAQQWHADYEEACRRHGWDIVRRPTGGRAILHIDELTYSVCAPEREPRVQGGILLSYRRLSDALAAGLERLGLHSSRAGRDDGEGKSDGPACFDAPSNFEITVGGRKLIGSAQARKQGVVLQHGTLPLYGDITRIAEALSGDGDRQNTIRQRLRQSAITLEESLGQRLPYDRVAKHIAEGFAQALNLRLERGELTPWEKESVQTIRAEKFAAEAWTRRL